MWGGAVGGRKPSRLNGLMCVNQRAGAGWGKDLRRVNLRLLGKWRWCLIEEGVWNLIASKYGVGVQAMSYFREVTLPFMASVWWKDICLMVA